MNVKEEERKYQIEVGRRNELLKDKQREIGLRENCVA
jgi:hypothetical protein